MKQSKLESKFFLYWKSLGGPEIEKEFRFHPKRRWRFDAAIPSKKIGIEINGGIWVKSGHSSGTGLTRDAEKLNEAVFEGWRVFVLVGSHITAPYIERLIEYVKNEE